MAKRTSKAVVKSKPAAKSRPGLKSKAKSKAKPKTATAKTPAFDTKAADPKAAEAKTSDAKPAKPAAAPSAVEMGARQREISVSEFFTKNRHLLGFDNPRKALLTCVKEAVDNALDAAEEAGILPDVLVNVEVAVADGTPPPPPSQATRFRVTVIDNGPGIVKAQIPKIFGQLLYGSKFHRLRQSRGQQGIGISAAGMYGQLTTGRPIKIASRTGPGKPGHEFEIQIDTKRNQPVVVSDRELDGKAPAADKEKRSAERNLEHGTRVELEIEATYKKG